MYTIKAATVDDFETLRPFYSIYYPKHHPLFHKGFWKWQFGSEGYGRCLLALNDNGEVAGHLGCLPGGECIWLTNILVNKTLQMKGLIDALFAEARKQGPLAVALANPAGAALLAKKGWKRQANLRRFVWRHPQYESVAVNAEFFKPILKSFDLPAPAGHYWQQPGLEAIQFEWGDVAAVVRQAGGLRLFECLQPRRVQEWAKAMDIRWMDAVCRWNDPIADRLGQAGWKELVGFPWFLNPVELHRNVDLNLFSENGLVSDFVFKRYYADMGRVGRLVC